MDGGKNARLVSWLLLAAFGLAAAATYALSFERFDQWSIARPLAFFALGATMLGLASFSPHWKTGKTEAAALLILALLLRIALLPTPPSDDIHRYLWEGKLVTEGISPYSLRGDHPDLAPQRDEQWELMNNKDKLTAYPPGSLLTFAGIAATAYHPLAFKAAFVIVDMSVVALILLTLRKRRLPLRNAAFYAFNPVVLISFAAEGHFDVLMLFGLAAAGLCVERKNWLWAGCFLALAVHMKFIALLALPLLLWKGKTRAGIGFSITIILLSLPFYNSLPQLVAGLYDFGAARDFNGLPNLLGNLFDLPRESLHRPVQVLFAAVFFWRWFRHRGEDDWQHHWLALCGALLLLAPTVHFWYFSWIALPLAIAPSLLWVSLCITQGFYFLVWHDYAKTGIWDLLDRHSALLWAPALIFAIPSLLRFVRALRIRPLIAKRANDATNDDSILVVIPTLNAAAKLPACLQAIKPQLTKNDRIVIADAQSTDTTREIAERANLPVVDAPKGRGNQMHAGLLYSPSRYALIIHADTKLPQGALKSLRQHLSNNPLIAGGCLGQRFSANGLLPYRFIEFLNELRANLSGIAFGDQVQFFDRQKITNARFPAQPLMEDVELSLRIREAGATSYLGIESQVDPQKWKRQAPKRIALVLKLVATYLIQRLYSEQKAQKLSRSLYKIYYGS